VCKVNKVFSIIPCHRLPERSFKIRGKVFPLCARCTSIYVGYLFLPVLLFMDLHLSFLIGIVLNLPMLLDGVTQQKGYRKSNNFLRTVTGLLSGIGQMVVVVDVANRLFQWIYAM